MRNASLPLLGATLLVGCGTIDFGLPAEPVASITITGPDRAKVGDPQALVATLRASDGTVVQRPVTWSVTEPTMGAVSPGGVLVVSDTGALVVRAQVDDVTASHPVVGYDWRLSGDAVTQVLRLGSDNAIVDRHPDLAVLCAAGTFYVVVIADGIAIGSPTVAFRFDDAPAQGATWLVGSDTGTLIFPGTTNASHKNFATAIAASSRFRFTFQEASGSTHELDFRVTGLADRLPPLLAGCPVDA